MNIIAKYALVATFGLTAGAACAQDRLSIGTASSGSNPYVVGAVIAAHVSEDSDYAVTAQTTGGYNENLGLVAAGQLDMALNFLPDIIDAQTQEGAFKDMPGTEAFKDLRLLFPVYLATYHYFVRAESGVTSFEELKGKRFNVNVPSTATYRLNMGVIDALGYTPEDFALVNLSGKDTYDALRNRVVDASGTSVAIGGGPLLELASSIPIHLLDLPDDAFTKLNADFNDSLVRTTIPGGTYPGQEQDNVTYSVPAVLFTNASLDEETAYQFTKAYWESWETMSKEVRTLAEVDIGLAAQQRKIPFHPGAERYFRERGLIK